MADPQGQRHISDARYEVLEFLAEGGMGSIYLGKKRGAGGFEKQVVLKQLRPEYTEQQEFIDLFLREARLSASLDHANIVHTIDLVHAGSDYFMVMEYVRGGDLRMLLKRAKKRKRWPSPAAALHVTREVLAALVYAHERRGPDGQPLELIHRDVSPSNILISGNGEVKLTDFGIAKATTHESVFYRVRGKVGYMSPEQARSQPLAPRSDVYSVAVILYELLTGEKLHVPPSLTTSADELYAQPVPAVTAKNRGLPAELDDVLWRGLAVNPEARYQTAREMLEALREIAARHDLGFSALELARHLVEVCGPVAEWGSSVVKEAAPPAEATAGAMSSTAALPESESSGASEDLLWVDRLGARAPRPIVEAPAAKRGETGRFSSVELRPVEEFIAERVVTVEPSRARPRRRVGGVGGLVVFGSAAVALAVALTSRKKEAPPAAVPAPAPAPAPAPPSVPVEVDSDPPGARVLLDGQVRCMTPCLLEAPAGESRVITIEKDGFLPWWALVVPDAARGARADARLRRVPLEGRWGVVTFRNAPPANLLVDGKPVGYATSVAHPVALPPGDHRLTLVPVAGGAPRELAVTVEPGEAAQVDVP
jgi:tRNA A-37 threonylcarbamoyl transferase component Bud32